jgi:tetratricopeptide (TPR) repeat protein
MAQSMEFPFSPPALMMVYLGLFLLLVCGGKGEALAQLSEADVLVSEALILKGQGRNAEAQAYLSKAITRFPNHAEAWYHQGLLLLRQHDLNAALQAFQKSHDLDPSRVAITYQLGMTHFALQEYGQAHPFLSQVYEVQPYTPNLGYYVGFLRYRLKNYQDALEAFQAGETTDPRIQELTRFYSGLALAILGLPGQAAQELDAALRVQTVSPLMGPAGRFRKALITAQEQQKEDRFHGELRFGVFYDDNVAVIPLSTGDTTVQFLRARTNASIGESFSGTIDYAWLRAGLWESVLSYSGLQVFNNSLPDFNIQNHLLSMNFVYQGLVGHYPMQPGVQWAFDRTFLGGDQFLDRFSGTGFLTVVEGAHHLTTILGRVQIKDFQTVDLSQVNPIFRPAVAEDDRDGTNWMLGLTHVFRFSNDRHLLRIGYQFDTDRTMGNNFTYNGHRAQAGGLYTFPWRNIRFRYDLDVYHRQYLNPNTRFNETSLLAAGDTGTVQQHVIEHNHLVRLEVPLPRNLTFSIDWQGTFSRSNLDLVFNFDRQVVTSSIAWSF